MRTRFMRAVAALTAVAAALLAGTACGGGTGTPDGTDPHGGTSTEAGWQSETRGGAATSPDPTATEAGGTEADPPKQVEETDVMTLCGILKSTCFSQPLRADGPVGLCDPSAVGVDRERMDEARYPVPDDAAFAEILQADERGITPASPDNSGALNALLEELRARGEGLRLIRFPQGTYRFSSTICLSGVRDLYLAGDPSAEFLMDEWTPFIRIDGSENIHLNGLRLDYAVSPSITGKVVSADQRGGSVTVQPDPAFDLSQRPYNGGRLSYGNYMEYAEDEETGDLIPDAGGMLVYNSTGDGARNIQSSAYDADTGLLTLTFRKEVFRRPSPGTTVSVSFTMYEYPAVSVDQSSGFYMEDCRIYAAAGMAIHLYAVKDVYLNRAHLMIREGSGRLVTATADGLHTNDCLGELHLSNCLFERSHDDCVNICTFYKSVVRTHGSTMVCSVPAAVVDFQIREGDLLEILTPDMKTVGQYTVVSAVHSGLSYELTVDRPVQDVAEGYLVADLTRSPRTVIENCVFRNKRNRGILLQTRDSVIRNCVFRNILHGSLSLHSAIDIFHEGLIPRNILVENCKFLNDHPAAAGSDAFVKRFGGRILPSSITEIEFRNNFFCGGYEEGIGFAGAGHCRVLNNLFFRRRGPRLYRMAHIERSEDILLKDNCVCFNYPRNLQKPVLQSESSGVVSEGTVFYRIP